MGFTTKINMSENRLVKQDINTTTHFKGINVFSVPLEERRLGADYPNAYKTVIETNILTKFDYVAETDTLTIYFENNYMESSSMNIPSIDFDNTEPYTITPNFIGVEPYEIEGVVFYKKYSGYEYDLSVNDVDITDYGYTGNFYTSELLFVEADSLDYYGDNTVLTVEGNLYADRLLTKPKVNIFKLSGNSLIDNTTQYFIDDIFYTDGELTIDADLIPGQLLKIITTTGKINIINGEIVNGNNISTNKLITILCLDEKKLIII